MAHRLRHAMSVDPIASKLAVRADKLSGVVDADETYVGGKRRLSTGRPDPDAKNKTPVVALVERGGRVRCLPMERITSADVQDAIREQRDLSAHMMTDELKVHHGRVWASPRIATIHRHGHAEMFFLEKQAQTSRDKTRARYGNVV